MNTRANLDANKVLNSCQKHAATRQSNTPGFTGECSQTLQGLSQAPSGVRQQRSRRAPRHPLCHHSPLLGIHIHERTECTDSEAKRGAQKVHPSKEDIFHILRPLCPCSRSEPAVREGMHDAIMARPTRMARSGPC